MPWRSPDLSLEEEGRLSCSPVDHFVLETFPTPLNFVVPLNGTMVMLGLCGSPIVFLTNG